MIATDELTFLPLGGAGEIGMNLSLYGYGPPGAARWLMLDCGVMFGGGIPGVDVVLPDPRFIAERSDRLLGLVLTHAHEDHLGAVPYLWPRLRCPIIGSRYTLAVLRHKLAERDLTAEVPTIELKPGQRMPVGPFDVELIGVPHSIPQSSAVVIRTPVGVVLHTGDWKADDDMTGPPFDVETFRALGERGVLALVCDSTNVMKAGRSGSEDALLQPLTDLIGQCRKRVFVACFATNVARLGTLAMAARACGRDVVVTGMSLKRNYLAARECGYLNDVPAFIDDAAAQRLKPERTLVICTGAQGEQRGALAKLANDAHPNLKLESGDTVIFSSRVIPGNELAVGRIQNHLAGRGIEIVTDRQALIHVSGHPARDELASMYTLVRPRIAIPVHGETRHLVEHGKFAQAQGVRDVLLGCNGTAIRLGPGSPGIAEQVDSGRLWLDGDRLLPLPGTALRERSKVLFNGAIVASVFLDGSDRLCDVQVTAIGLTEGEDDGLLGKLQEAARQAIEKNEKPSATPDILRERIRLAIRRTARQVVGKRPLAYVHVVRHGSRQRRETHDRSL